MNQFVRTYFFKTFIFGILAFGLNKGVAQSVFDPNDPIVVYNPSAPPTVPTNGLPAKWVKTNRLSWNTSSYKAYIYRGVAFRLKFPKNYDPSGNTKYPLFLFFHGKGERGSIYDNEYQMYHGGQHHMNAVDNGKFNGFLLYPQTDRSDGIFTTNQRQFIMQLIENFLIPEVNIDPFRISVNGLSLGGYNVWQFLFTYPKLIASAAPISSASSSYTENIATHKFTPIWQFQGGLDVNPPPSVGRLLNTQAQAAGANFKYTEYPNEGHGCWNTAWNEKDYFPFLMRANKANPWPVFGRTEFCQFGGPFSTIIGVESGFDEYQWMKDGVVIPDAASNTLTVTEIGIYSCRIRKGTTWSSWSPIPVQIKYKTATVTPDITVSGLGSRVLPSPDGKTTTALEVPPTFVDYIWKKVGDTTTLSTSNVLQGAVVGSYTVKATEQFACSSDWSDTFRVINANGPNKPSAPSNLLAIPMSFTSVKLAWTGDPGNPYAPTNFEIYQAKQPGGPYSFAAIVDGSTFSFVREGLTPGTKYYFIVRAINNTAGSGISNEANAVTLSDKEPPTAPANVRIVSSSRTSIGLAWDESSDNVAVKQYEIFINGTKSYATSASEYTVYNLEYGKKYNITVRAVDVAGNASAFSNQVTAQPLANGLNYKHYVGSWTSLPDFSKLTPIAAGTMPNVNIAGRSQDQNYAYLWQGYIRLPNISGTYFFRTISADGSRLYLSEYSYTATPLVDNDGVHGTRDRSSSISLTGGSILPITITYFQGTTGNSMSIRWRMPGTNTYVLIPDSAFVEGPLPLAGTAPNKPTNLVANPASYNRVNLSWTDNSNDEAKFEIFRSTDSSAGFASVAVLPANTTSFSDTLVAASTKYFYRVRAANQYGESDFDRVGSGVSYEYYEVDGMTATPDFNKLIPKSTGVITNFNLGVQDRADNFAMRYKSVINIPTTGNYTFYTRSDDGSKLFIDGQYVVQNDFVQGSTERSGTVNNLSAGPHVIEVHYFEVSGSEVLIVNYAGPSIPKGLIPDAILGQVPVSVTTPVGPAAPAAPGGLAVKGISSSSIRVTWTYANIANANSLELYRSFNDNQNYVLLATLPVSTVLYLDTALYPSSLFYYKVRAVGVGGPSSYTDEKSARSLGVIPSIKPIEDIYMRFNSQLVVPLEATSGSPTAISLSLTNKPAFATFDSTGNGMGNLTLNPAESDQGTYTITLTAKNSQGNAYSVQFKVIVNSNYVPDIATVSNQSVNEKQTKQVMLSATDGDAADILSWSLGANTPSFATIASNNRTATISLAPGYSDAGTYKILVLVNDGRNGKDTLSFNLTVVDVATSVDDGTAPTKVKDLAGTFVTNLNAVRLTWTNTAYNAQRNEVYRSTSISGAYTLLNPAATNKDSTAYTDSSAAGNRIYYYVVRTVNNNGSENSSRIQVSTPNKAPVISVAETLYVKATNSATVNIVTTDDPGETIAVAFSGLPSFATFSSTGNGTGNLDLHPNNSQVGSYNISVVATDDYGVSTTKVLRIVVTDSYYTNVYLKFNTVNNPYPSTLWNSMNATMKSGQTTANFTLSNLKDETQAATGINCTLVDTWPEHTSGIVTGNNSGVYPDEVLRTGYHFYVKDIVPQKVIRFSGLNANKRYNFTFFASRSASTPQVSNYTIGTETVSLDSRNNTSNTVKISGIAPDANGQVQVVVDAAMGKYGVINGMVIQYYDANTVSPPSRLKVALSEKTAVNLAWENNTQGITGFEVWRSDAANGTFVQLPGIVASNVFTYKDAGLSPGSTFFYKVRSILPSGFSEFSDVVRGSTLLYAISVNFNDGSANGPAASAPWNNTNLLVYEGYTLSNMINDANQYSGIDMTVVGSLNSFSGLNRQDNTMTTGDNSGFVPDVVMSTFYFLEYTQVGKLKLSGLNKSLKYNFIFFSACKDRGVPQITTYSVGNESVNLDAKNNISNFAAINNIIPDENGEALISLTPAAQGGFGYIGSLIIQAIPSDEAGGSSSARKATGTASNGAGSALVSLGNDAGNDNANIIIGAYPNPIVEDITIKFSLKKAEQRAVVTVRDITGKPVFTKTLNNLPAGESNQKIGINARRLMPGLYSVQVQALSNNERASIMVVK